MEGMKKTEKQFTEMVWGKTKKKKSNEKCPPIMRNKTRKRWWGDKIIGECFCCGRKALHFEDAQVGRIKAGGEYTPENSRLICGECNRGMGKTNMKIYMKRNYPERYQKHFPKETKTMKKNRKKKIKTKEHNPFEIPKIKIPKYL
jgi:hypothetical protein